MKVCVNGISLCRASFRITILCVRFSVNQCSVIPLGHILSVCICVLQVPLSVVVVGRGEGTAEYLLISFAVWATRVRLTTRSCLCFLPWLEDLPVVTLRTIQTTYSDFPG